MYRHVHVERRQRPSGGRAGGVLSEKWPPVKNDAGIQQKRLPATISLCEIFADRATSGSGKLCGRMHVNSLAPGIEHPPPPKHTPHVLSCSPAAHTWFYHGGVSLTFPVRPFEHSHFCVVYQFVGLLLVRDVV